MCAYALSLQPGLQRAYSNFEVIGYVLYTANITHTSKLIVRRPHVAGRFSFMEDNVVPSR